MIHSNIVEGGSIPNRSATLLIENQGLKEIKLSSLMLIGEGDDGKVYEHPTDNERVLKVSKIGDVKDI